VVTKFLMARNYYFTMFRKFFKNFKNFAIIHKLLLFTTPTFSLAFCPCQQHELEELGNLVKKLYSFSLLK